MLDRVLRAFELAEDGRGRRAYVGWLEARAKEDGGKISEEPQAALRRGWYLGEESFKDKLLAMMEKAKRGKGTSRKAAVGVGRDHGEAEAERLIGVIGEILDLPVELAELETLRKGDEMKVLLAALLRRRTAVGVNWIAERLAMGHPGSVSRLLGGVAKRAGMKKRLGELDEMLDCGD